MTGVEILATQEVAIAFGFCWAGFICLAIAGLFFGAFLYLGYESIPASLFIFVFALAAAFVVGFKADGIPSEYETHYKVTISDEVSMNDFLERYEILEQEGKIYTVRERDGETE
jgi:hypothetical protein